MNKIYIISPTHVATGGTELLQQLCYYLNKFGKKCFMYYTEKYLGSPVEKRFTSYSNPIANAVEDESENIVIVPETRIDSIKKYNNAQIYIWWLSVDNYYGSGRKKVDLPHKVVYYFRDARNMKIFRNCQHLVQSEYAKLYLCHEKGVKKDRIQVLSDYLNQMYLVRAISEEVQRENNILYNPKKGFEFTKLLIKEIHEYNWVPLENLTPVEIQNLLQRSKVYIDFGNHPGKDRIPREAAISGCCVITGKRGAAGNNIDVPIKPDYKFGDTKDNIEAIHTLVIECMEKYNEKSKDFFDYRRSIIKEEYIFCNTVKDIFKL